MANAAVDLTLLATVKEHMNVTGTTFDTILERIITAASLRIANFCDRKFILTTYTEFQHGRASNTVLLKHFPADKPTELNIDPESVFPVDTVVDTADFEVMNDSLLVMLRGLKFPRGTRNIKIIYTAGYDPPGTASPTREMPTDLEYACIQFVEYLFAQKDDRSITQTTKGKQGETTTFVTTIPDQVREAIEPYKQLKWPINNVPVLNA